MKTIKPSFSQGFARNSGESANPTLWKGLSLAWAPMLGQTGRTLKDMSGYNMDGTITGATWVIGDGNQVLDFAAADEIVGSNLAYLDFERTNAFSLFIRYKIVADGFVGLISKAQAAGDERGWLFSLQGGGSNKLQLLLQNTTANSILVRSVANHTTGQWYNFGVSYDGSDDVTGITMYRDGLIIADSDDSNTLSATIQQTEPVRMAQFAGAGAQQIGVGLVYNRVLSADEFHQLHLNPVAPFQLRRRNYNVPAVGIFPDMWHPETGRQYPWQSKVVNY